MRRELRFARLAVAVIAVALAASSTVFGDPAARASAQIRPAISTSLTVPGGLNAVSATSPTDAWAVGSAGHRNKADTLLIVHWDGVSWKQVTVPHFPYGILYAVTAVSKNDVWAIGMNETRVPGYLEPPPALVLHWNGTVWRPVSSLFDTNVFPLALSATAKEVWIATAAPGNVEFLHYVGGHWYFVPVGGQPANESDPDTLVMTGPKSGWLTFSAEPSGSHYYNAYFMRWDGTAWKHVPVKIHAGLSEIDATAGLPGGDVWAVGREQADPNNGNTTVPLSLRWDGKAWQQVPVNIQGAYEFDGVARIPGGTAWAVGFFESSVSGALVARWTGTAWKLAPSPTADSAAFLNAVTATSANDAWAVGTIAEPPPTNAYVTVILHWNGKAWS